MDQRSRGSNGVAGLLMLLTGAVGTEGGGAFVAVPPIDQGELQRAWPHSDLVAQWSVRLFQGHCFVGRVQQAVPSPAAAPSLSHQH